MLDFIDRQKNMFSEDELNKITNLNVLIAGCGGLGTNQAQQLQRIGINKIYAYDYDKIDLSNLNRQIFYGKKDIGKNKVDVFKSRLDDFNLETEIEVKNIKISEETTLPNDIDLVFDALDNIKTRFILEKKALDKKVPLIHGGVTGWFGQILVITPENNVRLKDIFQDDKNNENPPPVFSPVVTTVAAFQVIEGLKLIIDHENKLKDELLLIDMIEGKLDKVTIKPIDN
ncbi:MAG: HesA/MoeB/ThiF family protein [Halanaerobiales bacterium]|nr:HesA/MoeB/ThiF family protein [Halanaerobiales bacterium]